MEKLEASSRGRHALAAMVELSKQQSTQPVPLADIAASKHISLSYLEQMFAGLRRHGLVKSHRGPGGGYVLGMPAAQISVAAIVSAAEDSLPANRAMAERTRMRRRDETSEKMWDSLNALLFRLLERVSLDDVAAERIDVYKEVFKTEG